MTKDELELVLTTCKFLLSQVHNLPLYYSFDLQLIICRVQFAKNEVVCLLSTHVGTEIESLIFKILGQNYTADSNISNWVLDRHGFCQFQL